MTLFFHPGRCHVPGLSPGKMATAHLPGRMLLAGLLLAAALGLPGRARAAANAIAEGAKLYSSYCAVCHGDQGNGKSRAQASLNPPPRDFTSAALPRERMLESVSNGRPGTAMSAWKTQLRPQQIAAVVDYVRQTFMPAEPSAQESRGRQVFSKNCSVCHGDHGDGRSRAQASLNPPPRDFTAPEARAELSLERMLTSVSYGRADTAMAGFKGRLSQEDIQAVVAYIRSSFMGLANEAGRTQAKTQVVAIPGPVDMAAPMPHGLQGDAAKGGVFFQNNCATCHGKDGDGRGPRAYFINPKPRNFLHTASRQEFNRVKLFEMISNGERGTEMPAWKQVLGPQEIANVAEYVFQQFIQAQPQRPGVQP